MPNRYIGRKFMSELDEFQPGSSLHLYEKLKSMPIELPYIRKNVREFIQLMDPLIEDAFNRHPSEVINLLRVALDYDRAITDDDIPNPDDVKIENLNHTLTRNFQDFWQQSIGRNNKINIQFELDHYSAAYGDKAGKPYLEFWIKEE